MKRCHSREQHHAEEKVDRRPLLGGCDIKAWVIHPLHFLAKLDANDSDDGLNNNKKNIQININQVVVTDESIKKAVVISDVRSFQLIHKTA